jgi:hypothetical protein
MASMAHRTRGSASSVVGAIYLNCPCCGLTITPRASWLTVEHCPRCIARNGIPVGLFASTLPTGELYAADAAPDADRFVAPPAAERRR